MSALKFNTTILTAGKTATGICIPDNIIEELGAGKKPPIKVTLNGYTYRSTVAVMGGKYMVGVNAAVREAAGVKGGDQLTVAIELDTEERTIDVPAEFQQMLNKNTAARKIFETLSNSKKKALTLPVANAKTDETRNRNIEKALNSLLNPLKSILFIIMALAAFRSNAQQIKPSNSGYAPVNG